MADPSIADDEAERKREERRALQKARDAAKYLANKESINARRVAWGKANPDRQNEANKRAYKRNRKKRLADKKTQYARKRAEAPPKVRKSPPQLTAEQIQQKLEKRRRYHREYGRVWREANPGKTNEFTKAWRDRNPDRAKEIKVAYRLRNLEKVQEADRLAKRLARKTVMESGDAALIADYKEKRRIEALKWFQENTERAKELKRQSELRLRTNDPKGFREKRRQNYIKNKESCYAATVRWLRENPEKRREYSAIRKARTLGAEGRYTGADVKRLMKQQKGKCVYCAAFLKSGYDVDHIIALSKGGSNAPSNIQLLCISCNRRKWAKDPLDFASEMGMLV